MAVKKAVTKSAPAKKPASKPKAKNKVKAGDKYKCQACGLVVTVDEECGCIETCDIICCEAPMKKKR